MSNNKINLSENFEKTYDTDIDSDMILTDDEWKYAYDDVDTIDDEKEEYNDNYIRINEIDEELSILYYEIEDDKKLFASEKDYVKRQEINDDIRENTYKYNKLLNEKNRLIDENDKIKDGRSR